MSVNGETAVAPHNGARPLIRVLVVDDHEVVRQGVTTMLEATGDITVCGHAGGPAEAVEQADALRPDVVTMDVRLAGGSGIEATRDIRSRHPATKVIILTSFDDERALFASIVAGASGYVLKQILGNDLVAAVRLVAAGECLLDPSATNSVPKRLRESNGLLMDQKLARLTPREEPVLALVARGLTNGQIAEELFISEKTVKNHLSRILSKLEVTRRSEAAAYLAEHTRMPGS